MRSSDAILVTLTGPSCVIAFTPNNPLFCPENVTNSVAGNERDIFPASNF